MTHLRMTVLALALSVGACGGAAKPSDAVNTKKPGDTTTTTTTTTMPAKNFRAGLQADGSVAFERAAP